MTRVLNAAMDNLLAWRLGDACAKAAADPKAGDLIDRGLILLRELNARGFDVIQREAKPESFKRRWDQAQAHGFGDWLHLVAIHDGRWCIVSHSHGDPFMISLAAWDALPLRPE